MERPLRDTGRKRGGREKKAARGGGSRGCETGGMKNQSSLAVRAGFTAEN